jgi:hypothetical protein
MKAETLAAANRLSNMTIVSAAATTTTKSIHRRVVMRSSLICPLLAVDSTPTNEIEIRSTMFHVNLFLAPVVKPVRSRLRVLEQIAVIATLPSNGLFEGFSTDSTMTPRGGRPGNSGTVTATLNGVAHLAFGLQLEVDNQCIERRIFQTVDVA